MKIAEPKHIELDFLKGDLLDQDVDFIVNASNTTLKLGSGVSMVLKRACGSELQNEMDKIREDIYKQKQLIEPGSVFATPSFNLSSARFILHAAVINYNPGVKQFEGKPKLDTIRQILENCIPYIQYFYDKTGRKPSIAFPLLGCGVGGLDKNDVKAVFVEFTKDFEDLYAEIVLVDY